MLMDDNEINENDSDGNVSVHSIVTDKEDFDSDNESPQDQRNQVDKIKDNHVTKKINIPGKGVDKPSKFDYLQINYTCYFIGEQHNPIILNRYIGNYIYKIVLPYGVIKALKFMRKGERSFITLEPKYGFRRVSIEKFGRYIEIDQISKAITDEFNNDTQALLTQMQKTTLIYDVELVSFEKIYSLTEKRNLMKRIISDGKGITRPSSNSHIEFSLRIFNNDSFIFSNERIECEVSSSLLTECERIIIQSMKKKEKCHVDVLNSYFNETIQTANGIVNQTLKNNYISGRIGYEVELFTFNNKNSTIELKQYQYTKTIISKGIGNISPWKDSLIMLACELSVNDSIVYSDIDKSLYDSFEAFTHYIKAIKKEIKQKRNYEKTSQFIINEYFNETSFPIYDELEMNVPFVFRKEILQGMKPLTILNIAFTIPNNHKAIEDNYFRFGCFDICSLLANASEGMPLVIEFNVCLINFEENVSVFNNRLITDKAEKIRKYKEIANEFYMKGFIKTAKKINKKLSDSYIKALNLGKKIQMNDDEIVPEKKDKELFGKETEDNMRKIMSNLIVILFKMGVIQLCQKYIGEFIQIFGFEDEKVYYHKMRIHRQKGEYDLAGQSLDVLITISPNNNHYKIEKKEIDNIINGNSLKQVSLLKKMMKSI